MATRMHRYLALVLAFSLLSLPAARAAVSLASSLANDASLIFSLNAEKFTSETWTNNAGLVYMPAQGANGYDAPGNSPYLVFSPPTAGQPGPVGYTGMNLWSPDPTYAASSSWLRRTSVAIPLTSLQPFSIVTVIRFPTGPFNDFSFVREEQSILTLVDDTQKQIISLGRASKADPHAASTDTPCPFGGYLTLSMYRADASYGSTSCYESYFAQDLLMPYISTDSCSNSYQNQWMTLGVVFDGAQATFYVNGQRPGSLSAPFRGDAFTQVRSVSDANAPCYPPARTVSRILVGEPGGYRPRYSFAGSIAHMHIWKRALSSQEMALAATSLTSLPPPPPALSPPPLKSPPPPPPLAQLASPPPPLFPLNATDNSSATASASASKSIVVSLITATVGLVLAVGVGIAWRVRRARRRKHADSSSTISLVDQYMYSPPGYYAPPTGPPPVMYHDNKAFSSAGVVTRRTSTSIAPPPAPAPPPPHSSLSPPSPYKYKPNETIGLGETMPALSPYRVASEKKKAHDEQPVATSHPQLGHTWQADFPTWKSDDIVWPNDVQMEDKTITETAPSPPPPPPPPSPPPPARTIRGGGQLYSGNAFVPQRPAPPIPIPAATAPSAYRTSSTAMHANPAFNLWWTFGEGDEKGGGG